MSYIILKPEIHTKYVHVQKWFSATCKHSSSVCPGSNGPVKALHQSIVET